MLWSFPLLLAALLRLPAAATLTNGTDSGPSLSLAVDSSGAVAGASQRRLVRRTAPTGPACAVQGACASSDAHLRALRCRQWPAQTTVAAPRIAGLLYINLEADGARRRWMEAQIESLRRENPGREFRAERLAAVDARRAEEDEAFSASRARGFSAITYPNVTGSWGAAACLLSHQQALRRLQAAAREGEVWLVLEDDAKLPSNLFQEWERLWRFLPEDWDVARLGWFGGESCEGRVNTYVDLALWSDPPPGGPCSYCGSQAYAVNPKSAARVLRRLETAKIMHVDCLLGARTPPGEDPALLPEIRSYAFRPAPVLQNEDFPSDRD